MTEFLRNLSRSCVLFVGVTAALVLAGCEQESVNHPPPFEALTGGLASASGAGGEVIARVDGVALTRRDFELFWRDHPDYSREQALDAMIAREVVLARWTSGEVELGEEPRRELATDLTYARKRGLVRALLDREVEQKVDVGVPDEQTVDTIVNGYVTKESTPAGYRIDQLVVAPKKDAPPEDWKRAEELVRDFDARITPDRDILTQMQELYEETGGVKDNLYVRVNQGLTFKSSKAGPVLAKPEGWLDVFPEVVKETERVAAMGGEGSRTPPVRSQVGWHILLIDEVIPASQPSPEEIQDHVAREYERGLYSQRYSEFATPLVEAAYFELYPENLEESATSAAPSGPNAKAQ